MHPVLLILPCGDRERVRDMDVRPLHAVLMVTLAAVLIGLAAYSGTKARQVMGPSDLRVDRVGNLHLRIGQAIFVYDSGHNLVDTYSLDDFGVTGLLGSFEFFADNSLLLVADSLADGASGEKGQLLRCSFSNWRCTPLFDAKQRFRRSFRTWIDHNDNIFLSDTARDAVYWLEAGGGKRNELLGAVEQPGQVRRQRDRLVIANTDGGELLFVPLRDGNFTAKQDWQHIPVDSADNKSRRERRPTDFVHLPSGWYILAKTTNGRRGSVYHYTDAGEYRARIALPDGADPLAIAYHGDTLLVADYAGLAVYRFTASGERLEDLQSPAQRDHLENLQQRKQMFSVIEYASWGVFALALLVGFIVAIRGELRKAKQRRDATPPKTESTAPPRPTTRPHPMEAGIHWLAPKKTALWMGVLLLCTVLLMPLLMIVVAPEGNDPKQVCTRYALNIALWGFTAFMLVIFVPLILKMRTVVRTRLGFRDEWVLVDHGNGTIYIARDEDLIGVNNGFMIDGVTIPTGNPNMALYNSGDLDTWLKPRLARGKTLGPIQQLTWQWHNRRGLFIVSAIGICAGLVLVVAMEAGWLEKHFKDWLDTQPECRKPDPVQNSREEPAK